MSAWQKRHKFKNGFKNMGVSLGSGGQGGGRRGRRGKSSTAIADINMTPFIDVMLVLLIVFMVAAPLLTSGVPIDLPQTSAKPLNVEQKPLTLSINEQGQIFFGELPISEQEIVPQLKASAKQGAEERIYVRGHKKVDYGKIAQVMSIVTSAGFKKVALLTEADGKNQ
jgi:biopolymer transport protein TolR